MLRLMTRTHLMRINVVIGTAQQLVKDGLPVIGRRGVTALHSSVAGDRDAQCGSDVFLEQAGPNATRGQGRLGAVGQEVFDGDAIRACYGAQMGNEGPARAGLPRSDRGGAQAHSGSRLTDRKAFCQSKLAERGGGYRRRSFGHRGQGS